MNTIDELFQYISDFYRTVDGKLNLIIKSIQDNRKHMTSLYAFDCDVSTLPKATGHLRIKQMAVLKLLLMIDSVLHENNIKYFLGYGNLLGAARTGDFIPWDDDADICLMRDDFERAVVVLQANFDSGDFSTQWGISGRIFKVKFMDKICVDLFPWDTYYTRMDKTELADFKEKYITAMELARKLEFDIKNIKLDSTYSPLCEYSSYSQIRDDIIMGGKLPDYENGDIYEAIDWQTFPERISKFYHNCPFRREYIFPLGEIEFCGYKFPAPNNVDAWLTTRFGDWRTFKPEFNRHTGASFTWEELNQLKQFIAEDIK